MTTSRFSDPDGRPLGSPDYTVRSATFSDDRRHRYTLHRRVSLMTGIVLWIMLNPSTADDERDDATIRRCTGYAQAWNYGTLSVVNLFPFRSTDPKALALGGRTEAMGPIGVNDHHILVEAIKADLVMCGWGAHGHLWDRGKAVVKMLTAEGIQPHYLTMTQGGQPGHPLRLNKNLKPIPWELAA